MLFKSGGKKSKKELHSKSKAGAKDNGVRRGGSEARCSGRCLPNGDFFIAAAALKKDFVS